MSTLDERAWLTSVGPATLALEREVLRVVVGSRAHGLSVPGTDDSDEMGVYVPPPAHELGVSSYRQGPTGDGSEVGNVTLRTRAMGERSGPGDVDLSLYPLRRYLALAAAGNPTVLVALYVPAEMVLVETEVGRTLRGLADLVVSRRAGDRFLGYLDTQLERLEGRGRQSRVPSRPELVEAHGYDTKYAMHALRLGLQGVELMTTGRLTLPMSPADRELCMQVRRGEATREVVMGWIQATRAALVRAVERGDSPLPEQPDWALLDEACVLMHSLHWVHWGARPAAPAEGRRVAHCAGCRRCAAVERERPGSHCCSCGLTAQQVVG